MKNFGAPALTLISLALALAACSPTPPPPTPVVSAPAPAPAMSTPVADTTSKSTTRAVQAQLAGSSEVPPVSTSASGTFAGELNAAGEELTWKLDYSGLSGPVTAAHFHGPTLPGQNAGVIQPITAPYDSPISGKTTLTAAQATEITDGKWYVNLHTAAHPDGEIRGQLTVRP